MKNKNIIRFVLLLIIINGISLLAGALNWLNQFFITGSLFFIGGLVYRKKWHLNKFLYGLLLLLPFTGIYAGFVFTKGLSHIYPIALIPMVTLPVGLLINRMFNAKEQLVKKSTSILIVFGLITLGAYVGMPNWLSYSFSAPDEYIRINPEDISGLKFTDMEGSIVSLGDLKGKIVILDFWSTGCGVCYKKFPEFEKLYQTYKHNDKIVICAVNLALKKQTAEQIEEEMKQLGYTFPNLFVPYENRNSIKNTFRFNAVPTLIVMDKNGLVHYKGSLVTSHLTFVNNVYRMIDELLEK